MLRYESSSTEAGGHDVDQIHLFAMWQTFHS